MLLRAAHASTRRPGDGFFQTNTLAVLCNLAPHATALSPDACRRLVSLVALLHRRCRRQAPGAESEQAQLAWDMLRMALECVSAVLERALPANPALVYALVHQPEVFEELERRAAPADPALARPVTNIQARAVEGGEFS